MSIVRSQENPTEFVDYTALVQLVEGRQDNALEAMGLFEAYFGSSTTAEVERVTDGQDTIVAKPRGGERNYAGSENTRIEHFMIPFFPLDKNLKPNDVQDFKKYGEVDAPASVEQRVSVSVARIARSHDMHKRAAMYAALNGRTYVSASMESGANPPVPDGQYLVDFNDKFGIPAEARYSAGAFDFQDGSLSPSLFLEAKCRKHIVKYAADQADAYKIFALCGAGVFNSITEHPLHQAPYESYASQQEPLRRRLGGDIVGRVWEHKGITYVEDMSGRIKDEEMFVLPVGIADMFQIHYAPADTLEHANTTAQEMYIFYKQNLRAAGIETETSFVCVCTRPELICKLTFAAPDAGANEPRLLEGSV